MKIWIQAGYIALFVLCGSLSHAVKPNVILIICDDLNDYVGVFGGHPQAKTPNMDRLAASGVSFQQAHCTIPICNPSRASFLTGLYPHTSQCYGFDNWDGYEVLKNSRTLMDHFRKNGYVSLGTGKMMHNRGEQEWTQFGHPSDYGPFAYNEEKTVAHPWNKAPFRDDFGAIDGSFGPLFKLQGEISPENGKPFTWRTGNWKKMRELRYESDADRDPTGDELNARWAVEHLNAYAKKPKDKPFFMGVGFLRPHTPLIVPQEYFDRFPLESIELPSILENDAADTFKHTITSSEDDRSGDRGTKIYDSLIASFDGDRELALKKFVQAYLASVASVDDLVGDILDVVDSSPLKDNTIVILTSDHGWGNGEKDYLYKNSLWQESTRVPLVIRAPGVSKAGQSAVVPVSLVDLYPSLIDLCGLEGDTRKNEKGRRLDGYSLKPLLENPMTGTWDGPDAALTALYKWDSYYDPAKQSYSLRFKDWRYIRYQNGKEELYHTAQDPKEWTNLALNPEYAEQLAGFRAKLMTRIPESKPRPAPTAGDNEKWKSSYFKKHPEADTNGDGSLSWAELKAHKDGE
ncbi:Arylsulfatase [Pontiella desulfatans]|uniref:Arylsulfatase n=1 Tax=Pontiella desulfatans TaxID=2750659 RepID=A0A6C2TWE5_PONDE|nr:sulfatase [Pontiella desulfatans]SPS73637.1 sulfatase S1_7 [Kiritimatiellales bacterium]VGO11988.1 Arylsulfatase [Pontiella desulfatans]